MSENFEGAITMVMFNDPELKLIAERAGPSEEKVLLLIAAQKRCRSDPGRPGEDARSLIEPEAPKKSRGLPVLRQLVRILLG